MPGVIVTTQTRSGPASNTAPESARYMVAGLTERGPAGTPVLVRSMAEYEALLGPRVPYGYLYDDLKTFFEEGGAEAVVVRVVGPTATTGAVTLKDSSTAPGLDTLRVSAIAPGAWSSRLKVAVSAGTTAGTFRLTVTYDGVLVHDWDNLNSPSAAVNASASSQWVRISDLGSVTAAPGNNPAPITIAVPLTAGADDRSGVTASVVAAGLDSIGKEWGPGAIATPGYTSAQVGATLVATGKKWNRVALLATAAGASVAAAKSAAEAITVAGGGEYAALIYPWVTVPDGAATRTISPEGYAAAARTRAHRETGQWRSPAGALAETRYVLGPQVVVSDSDGDALDAARVSVIRSIYGTTRLYGWRSLSSDNANYHDLIVRDLLNYLVHEGAQELEPFVHSTVDARGHLHSRIESTLVGLVDPIRAAGGLYERIVGGEVVDPGYSVSVQSGVTTDPVSGETKIHAVMAVRPSPVGSLIELTIVKAGLTAQV